MDLLHVDDADDEIIDEGFFYLGIEGEGAFIREDVAGQQLSPCCLVSHVLDDQLFLPKFVDVGG